MEILKVQFEIRYNIILGFETEIPLILTPLQKIGGELLYSELQEGKYILLFRSDSYLIDIRNDRMIFISNNSLEKFIGVNGSFNHFINTFNKISSLPGFVKVNNKVLAKWFLSKNDNTFETNSKYFIDKYLSATRDLIDNIEDASFILESTSKDKISSKVTIGPFNEKKDMDIHNIRTPFDSLIKSDSINGFLMQSIVSETDNLFSIEAIRKLEMISNKLEKIKV